ncbi:MAG: translocation/assembly module TamB domain-containing protein [Muribaculaceae bacterium]
MKIAYKIIRSILVTGIVTCVAIYVMLFLILSIPATQNKIREIGEVELSKLLHTKVSIGSISIAPFNQVVLRDVFVPDQQGDTLLAVNKLGAGLSLYNLVVSQKIVFTYAEIIGLDGRVNKPNPKAPTNMQFIIDALSPKKKKTPPAKFDIKIFNVVIRKSSLRYDVLSEGYSKNKFDKNHISITNLTADISLPKLKNDDFGIKIKRLSLYEKSGLLLKKLTANAVITNKMIEVDNLQIELPHTVIAPEKLTLEFNSLKTLGKELPTIPLNFNIANSYVTPSDFSNFVPALANLDDPFQFTIAMRGTMQELFISTLNVVSQNKRISIDATGTIYDIENKEKLRYNIPHIYVNATSNDVLDIASRFTNISPDGERIITNCGKVMFDGSIKGKLNEVNLMCYLATSLGKVDINGNFSQNKDKTNKQFSGDVSTPNLSLGVLLNKPELLQDVAFDINLIASQNRGKLSASVNGDIKYVDFKGYRYNDIIANVDLEQSKCDGSVSINDPNISLEINGGAMLDRQNSTFDLSIIADHINLANLNINKKYPAHDLSFVVDASFKGKSLLESDGTLSLSDIRFVDSHNNGIKIDHFNVVAQRDVLPQTLNVNSDILNGDITGEYNFKSLIPAVKDIVAKAFPALVNGDSGTKNIANGADNNFTFNFTVVENNELTEFFNAPVRILYPIELQGYVNGAERRLNLTLNAPYIQQKNKLIENSSLVLNIDGVNDLCDLNVTTMIPTKKGNTSVALSAGAANNRLDTDVSWWIDNPRDFHGEVNLSTLVGRDVATNALNAAIDINSTEIAFNDTVWTVNPAKVDINNGRIEVNNFDVRCGEQYLKINGVASHDPSDKLLLELQDVNLDYVFETLAIGNVTFGGRGTGKFSASDIFTKAPKLSTPRLHVVNFSYNGAILGNADIESHWDIDTKGIAINADIKHANGYSSTVNGAIYPIADSIYLDFNAHKLDVRFLKPFLANITPDIQGTASGHATLFGSLKNIDLKGDILAENLKMKIGFINATYTTTDSVILRPGQILIKNITLKDKFGNTAILNGNVRHAYFRDAKFDFSITQAHNFLCLDIPQSTDSNWYGTIFGNGSTFITGEPGLVNIDVNMATAANSKFTFVLSKTQAANDYKFITFIDRNKKEEKADTVPEFVSKFKAQQIQKEGTSSRINLNIQVEATPLAQMTLVMDPVSGDKIKATGNGNLRLNYNSVDNDIRMFGNYTLEKGNYNFTLQDIRLRDFMIRQGSSISFHGDPMVASLDIAAIYAVNASLTDLDESFAQDKDLNRTNVPVHAVLNLKGDITQPAISFDVELPTLTQDAYRKVKSIINTEEMMNRQIIYLLALNRFYTPEYMGNTNKNNELASVASSTISSQLSSMLGQMSENWSISPNLRTNKGDFSDVEVEVALSSQLLNNRLLLNGNFGYRDNSLNSNSTNFIGDFDIEYILTKSANLRLKAYNHFNDQNYYIKNALTTQGVGIMVKHDFDRLFDFLKKKPKSSLLIIPPAKADTIPATAKSY